MSPRSADAGACAPAPAPHFPPQDARAARVQRGFVTRAGAAARRQVVLEPTFAAYHLSHATARERGNAYSGTNFSLPHRDYTHADSFDAHGAPKVLTLWVPVSEVAPDNGCMMVVPREFDPYHDRDDAARHMLVQHSGWLAGKSFLAFPLGGARALAPAAPATVMGWAGNTIHWGTNCHAGAAGRPRASIAWVFRRADAPHAPVAPPLARADVAALSLARRRALVRASMDFFKHWSTPHDPRAPAGAAAAPADCRG